MLASLLMSGLLSRRQVAHMAASWPSMRALAPRGGNPLWGDPLSAPDDPSGQRGYGYPPWQPPDLPAAAFCLHQHWHNLDTCWLVHHAKPLWLAFRCCTLLPCRLTLMHTLVCMYILHLVRLLKSRRWCRAMVTVGPPTRSFFPSIILRTLCWRHLCLPCACITAGSLQAPPDRHAPARQQYRSCKLEICRHRCNC